MLAKRGRYAMELDRRDVISMGLVTAVLGVGHAAAADCPALPSEVSARDDAADLTALLTEYGHEARDPALLLAAARARLWGGRDADGAIVREGLLLSPPSSLLRIALDYAGWRAPVKSPLDTQSLERNGLQPHDWLELAIVSPRPTKEIQVLVFINQPSRVERDAILRQGRSIVVIELQGVRMVNGQAMIVRRAGYTELSCFAVAKHPIVRVRNIYDRPISIRVSQR